MRCVGHLENGGGDREARPRRQVLRAQVEVDVELVACERPALALAGDERRGARVHQRHLGLRVRAASAPAPAVADEADVDVELALLQHLALVGRGPAHDQLEHALVGGRGAHLVEPGEDVRHRSSSKVVKWQGSSPAFSKS
jgi:hypothetical protein